MALQSSGIIKFSDINVELGNNPTDELSLSDPQNGGYVYVETEAEIEAKKAEMARNFYLSHTHNAPVSTVETNDEGQETWSVYTAVTRLGE